MASYAAETWTINQADKKRLEAMEKWVWRIMKKVKWTDKLTNEEVLSRVNESRGLMAHIKRRKSRWINHILRHENLLKIALEEWMEGKRPRGRNRKKMLNDIMEEGFGALKRLKIEEDRRT